MASAARQRRLRAFGVDSRVFEVGPPDSDEAIVFLHGQPGSAEDWGALMERVAPFSRAVALDLPGFGKAARPKELDYSAGTYATFIDLALRELGVHRAHLVMHDLGGVGLVWGVTHPQGFASAVLVDTGILIGFRWHPVARLYRTRPIGELMTALATRSTFRAVMRLYNRQPRQLPEGIVDRWWRDYDLGSRRAGLSFYRATPPAVMERLVEPLRQLDVPALVLWGAHDPAVPVEQAERQRESFPSAEIVVLDQSGHWPYLDDPDGSAAAIVPFLQRQVGSRGDA